MDGGVGALVDLRNEDEVSLLPERPPGVLVLRAPVEDQSDSDFMATWGHRLGSPVYYPEVLRRWPDLVARALDAIASVEEGSAVVVHCGAGRDRTGMISALLLEAAGVDRTAILDDYEVGVRSITRHFESLETSPERLLSPSRLDDLIIRSRAELATFLDNALVRGLLDAENSVLRRAAERLR